MALPMIFGGAAPPPRYQIDYSARFNGTGFLTRTLGAFTDITRSSHSFWMKRGALSLGRETDIGIGGMCLTPNYISSDALWSGSNNGNPYTYTKAAFRDPSAWMHVLVTFDYNATSGNRTKLYINGVAYTDWQSYGESYGIGVYSPWGYAGSAAVGNAAGASSPGSYCYDGYIAEVVQVDGQIKAPADFGKFDNNGMWVPIKYSGTYGAQGCKLEFKDAADLGLDTSGNGNNWTVNGLTAADRMADTPTNNFATLNPLIPGETTLSNGNLTISGVNSLWRSAIPTIQPFGKNYWEVSVASAASCRLATCGIADAAHVTSATAVGPALSFVSALEIYFNENWTLGGINADVSWFSGGTLGFTLPLADFQPGTSPILRFAFDGTTGRLWLGTSSGWYGPTGTLNGDPANGSNPTATVPASAAYVPVLSAYYPTDKITFNAGQSPFTYIPPEGFKTLCTANLPAVGIKKPRDHFNTVLYTGNGGTKAVTGLGFMPGLLWGKQRNFGDRSHFLQNEVVGAQSFMCSDGPGREVFQHENGYVQSFDADGFTLTAGSHPGVTVNESGGAYVTWAWKGTGPTPATNTVGTITSQVSANPTAGFSIATYTGTGTTATIGHGLGAAPKFIITKARTSAIDWAAYHQSLGNTAYLKLTTAAAATDVGAWNNTSPTAAVFSVGTNSSMNQAETTYVAYCFAEIPGYSKFGSYTGNSVYDGPFVHCGFRPRFIMWKRTDSSGNWHIHDSARELWNGAAADLVANNWAVEASGVYPFDLLSNGFKVRSNDAEANIGTYIYAAFAEHPFGGSNVSPSPAR